MAKEIPIKCKVKLNIGGSEITHKESYISSKIYKLIFTNSIPYKQAVHVTQEAVIRICDLIKHTICILFEN
jgi:phosphoribosylpyrophosphate synthetase